MSRDECSTSPSAAERSLKPTTKYHILYTHMHCCMYAPPAPTPLADEADMREVSHFLLELKNGSESRGDVVCEIPHSAPENEVGAGSDLGPPPPATPISLDPLQSASPDTKVRIVRIIDG